LRKEGARGFRFVRCDMFDVTKEAREKMVSYLKEREIEGALRVYMAYG
jgi:hypothetical protein